LIKAIQDHRKVQAESHPQTSPARSLRKLREGNGDPHEEKEFRNTN